MSQIFKPSANSFARLSILAAGLVGLVALSFLFIRVRSPYTVEQMGIAVEQPVRFSHKLHSGNLNIECQYCHVSAEKTAYGGIPDTHTCMSCHSQIATYSELLEPVRTSYETGESLVWYKVHDLAGHVYFNHSAHVNNGYACETCHGRVDEMPLVWQTQPLSMEWCLDCHFEPEQYVRPPEAIYEFGWQAPENQAEVGLELIEFYGTDTEGLGNCWICHR